MEPGEDAERRIKDDATLLHAKDIQFPPAWLRNEKVRTAKRTFNMVEIKKDAERSKVRAQGWLTRAVNQCSTLAQTDI